MAKYTACTIRFVDDGVEENVIIKDGPYENDSYDELIFFYGYSCQELLDGCENGRVFEGDWEVVSVQSVFEDYLP